MDNTKTYDFSAIDTLVADSIKTKAFPSAVILVSDKSQTLFHKAYGSFQYDDKELANTDTIYDCASLTKILSTTAAMMKLYEEGKYKLDDPVYKHIPKFEKNNKQDITIENLLLHNSGLKAYKFFHEEGITDSEVIINSVLESEKDYETGSKTVYSDFGFLTVGELVKVFSGKSIKDYVQENIWGPLQMSNTQYNPPQDIWNRIAPTEQDDKFRKKLVRGEVHDETCYYLGGATGHAGVFSNTGDIIKIMRVWLNKGEYVDKNGEKKQLFKPETIDLFTKCPKEGLNYDNTRALGFETKPKPTGWEPACGHKFSENCFGHTGFTGTSAWADKDKNLIVIALTNAVYPTREENRKGLLDFRTHLHDEVCKAVGY